MSAEVAALDRILTRLSLTDDDSLEPVLAKLIPMMIQKLDMRDVSKEDVVPVQKKVIEILTHANKRLQGLPSVKLPLKEVVTVYCESGNLLVKNFSLVYIEKGLERGNKEDARACVAPLLRGVAERPGGQRDGVLRVVCWCLGLCGTRSKDGMSNSNKDYVFIDVKENAVTVDEILENEEDRMVFLEFVSKMCLYASVTQSRVDQNTAPLYPGLSLEDVERMVGKGLHISATDMALGCLNFVARASVVQPKEVFLLYLCAMSSPFDALSQQGEELFRKTCVVDSARPTVDVNDADIVRRMYDLFLGNIHDDSVEVNKRRQPASYSVKSRLLFMLCKSTTAVNVVPDVLMVISDCLFGESITVSLQRQGMEFAVWVLRHGDEQFLQQAGPTIITKCIEILDSKSNHQDSSNSSLRSFGYQCIGQLAQRSPESLKGRVDIAQRCFEGLRTEPAGVRAAVQEATSCLASSFIGIEDLGIKDAIFEMIEENISSEQDGVRLASLLWAIRLFPFTDVKARYLCIIYSGDYRAQVADLALEGLSVESVARMQGERMTEHPDFDDMLGMILSRHPDLRQHLRQEVSSSLSPASFISAIKFLQDCERNDIEQSAMTYFVFLENALSKKAPSTLNVLSIHTLLEEAVKLPTLFFKMYSERSALFLHLLNHIHKDVSEASGRLLALLMPNIDAEKTSNILGGINSLLLDVKQGKRKRLEDIMGSLRAVGYILARRNAKSAYGSETEAILIEMLKNAENMEEMVQSSVLLSASYASLGRTFLTENDITSIIRSVGKRMLNNKDEASKVNIIKALGIFSSIYSGEEILNTVMSAIFEIRNEKEERVLQACSNAIVLGWRGPSMDRFQFLMFDEVVTASKVAKITQTREEYRQKVLNYILKECIFHTRKEIRFAGSLWLLDILRHCAEDEVVKSKLPAIQSAFCSLLGDDAERTMQVANRGVTLSYEVASSEMKEELVKELVSNLSDSTTASRKRRPGDLSEDTELFQPGSLGSKSGLSTYKEICSLATDLGQPDLIYQFMNLSGHQAAADASRGAAYGMASLAKIAGGALQPYTDAIVPKLYRSLHNPDPKVREAMKHIWVNLIDDERVALTKNFSRVMELLIDEMTCNQWKIREAASYAAADAIQSRTWEDMRPFFGGLWNSCLRVVDDVKESVRFAGLSLVRALAGLSSRLVDAEGSKIGDVEEIFSILLPILIEKGMNSNVQELKSISILTISRLVKVSGIKSLGKSTQILVPSLLEALSGLEDSRLNYIEQHAARLGLDSNKLEEERMKVSQTSPIGDLLDLCANEIDSEAFFELNGSLVNLIRKGVGSNTKAGTGKFISIVARRLGNEMKNTNTLMRALLDACLIESSSSVRRSYASAYAILAGTTAKAKVDTVVENWLLEYRTEKSSSQTCIMYGVLLKSFAFESPDLYLRYANEVGPVAFIASHDPDSSVAKIWGDLWEETMSATGSGVRAFAAPIIQIAMEQLDSGQWARKKIAAKAMIDVFKAAGDLLGPHFDTISTKLIGELSGRLWEGKEVMLDALGTLVWEADDPSLVKRPVQDRILDSLVVAASKSKIAYKTAAFVQLDKVMEKWSESCECKVYEQVWPILKAQLEDSMLLMTQKRNDENAKNGVPVDILIHCVKSLFSLKCLESGNALQFIDVLTLLVTVMNYSSNYLEQKTILSAIESIIPRRIVLNQEDPEGIHKVNEVVGQIPLAIMDIVARSKAEEVRLKGIKLVDHIISTSSVGDDTKKRILSIMAEHMKSELSANIKHNQESILRKHNYRGI